MFSRKATDSLIENSQAYKSSNEYSRGDNITEEHYDVFKIGVIKNINCKEPTYLPEDYYVCGKLRELGYKIYIDLTIPVKHNGMHGFVNSEQNLNRLISPSDSNTVESSENNL